jgi:hypothetical protein
MANKMSDTQMEASHLPGQRLQRKAHRQAQRKQTPDIAAHGLSKRKQHKARAASARRR